jgi:hypothetical protein
MLVAGALDIGLDRESDEPQRCARGRADDAGYALPTISPATRTLTLKAFPGR